tara:strand:+ start:2264 stop:2782 length:519 start_codon:yes stop_codon:yes gene_type:complete
MDWYYADDSDNQISFTEDQLQELVDSDSIKPSTLIWNETMADWQACSAVRPDLFGGDALPPALTSSQIKQVVATSPGDPNYKAPTDSVAICALVFGILGVVACLPCSLGGIICGHIARNRAKENPAASTNAGLALAGLITGYLGFAIGFFIMVVYGAVIFAAIFATNASGEF